MFFQIIVNVTQGGWFVTTRIIPSGQSVGEAHTRRIVCHYKVLIWKMLICLRNNSNNDNNFKCFDLGRQNFDFSSRSSKVWKKRGGAFPSTQHNCLKDASDSWPERFFFNEKNPRSIFELQKRVLKIWRWPSSQKSSIFIKESNGIHFTTVRARTALPPKVQPTFLKFASVWGC